MVKNKWLFRIRACESRHVRRDWSSGPVVTAATDYNVPSFTASVTLVGINFAPTDTTLTSALTSADCATSSWTTQTSAACIGVRGAPQLATAVLSVADIAGTSTAVFSFDGF